MQVLKLHDNNISCTSSSIIFFIFLYSLLGYRITSSKYIYSLNLDGKNYCLLTGITNSLDIYDKLWIPFPPATGSFMKGFYQAKPQDFFHLTERWVLFCTLKKFEQFHVNKAQYFFLQTNAFKFVFMMGYCTKKKHEVQNNWNKHTGKARHKKLKQFGTLGNILVLGFFVWHSDVTRLV